MKVTEATDFCQKLLEKKGILPSKNIALNEFRDYFVESFWYAISVENDGNNMINILNDNEKLVSGELFNKNFSLPYSSLVPKGLEKNKSWNRLMSRIISFKGKGIGAGELYLALAVKDWKFNRTEGKGDGFVAGGIREIKNNGASLKPQKEAVRVQDYLNETVLKGNRPGPISKFSNHRNWINSQNDPKKIYLDYFSRLYPSQNVNNMVDELVNIDNGQDFYNTIGKYVLDWYKEIDGWNSLIIIDQVKMKIVNITETSNLPKNIKFEWKSERGKDTQAITDGYVNIKI